MDGSALGPSWLETASYKAQAIIKLKENKAQDNYFILKRVNPGLTDRLVDCGPQLFKKRSGLTP